MEDTEIKGFGAWDGIAHPPHLHIIMEIELLGQTGTWGQARAAGQHVPRLWMLGAQL